jgi:hypothetical protein
LLFRPSEGAAQSLEVASHETLFTRQLLAFADVVADPSRASALATFEDGLMVAEMVDQAQRIAQVL